MRNLSAFLLLIGLLFGQAQALSEPLRVAVPHFLPPFVMQGAHNEMAGFDVELVNQICKALNRTCEIKPMDLDLILPAISDQKVDVGLGAITITLERYKQVNFSRPYMLSQSRFLGTKKLDVTPFNINLFRGKKIGVSAGSLFGNELALMEGIKPVIVTFKDSNDMVAALNGGSIDLALVDNPTAIYWQNHSSGALHALGAPFVFGSGLGIAINPNDTALTQAINTAIINYQQTAAFKQLYSLYFAQF